MATAKEREQFIALMVREYPEVPLHIAADTARKILHLEAVSVRINTLRGEGPAAVNAKKTRCAAGHLFTPGNTYNRKTGSRERICKTCASTRNRVAHQKRKAKK